MNLTPMPWTPGKIAVNKKITHNLLKDANGECMAIIPGDSEEDREIAAFMLEACNAYENLKLQLAMAKTACAFGEKAKRERDALLKAIRQARCMRDRDAWEHLNKASALAEGEKRNGETNL